MYIYINMYIYIYWQLQARPWSFRAIRIGTMQKNFHRASCTGLLLRQGLHRDAAPVLPGRAMRSIIHNAAFSMQQKNRSEKRAHFHLPVCSLRVLPHSGWASHLQRVLHAPHNLGNRLRSCIVWSAREGGQWKRRRDQMIIRVLYWISGKRGVSWVLGLVVVKGTERSASLVFTCF